MAEERHFGRAAERLRIAQSGLSLQIKALERTLHIELFDRGARPVRLTPEGERFLEHARVILELADRAVEHARDVVPGRRATLKFGTSVVGIGPAASDLLRLAPARLPDLDLRVHVGMTPDNIAALNRRTLDVVYSYIPFESPETPRYLRLGGNELVLAIPEHHRLARRERIPKAELAHEPFVVGPRALNPRVTDHILQTIFGRTDPPNLVEIPFDSTGRFRAVAEGVGISLVAVPMEALLPIPGIVYRRFEEPAPGIEYGLLWFDDHASAALPSFLELAREIAETHATSAHVETALTASPS